jgi:ABC-type sugar transport system substrate-binding protein
VAEAACPADALSSCRAAGVDAVMAEPFDPAGFTAVVGQAFSNGPGGPSILVQ